MSQVVAKTLVSTESGASTHLQITYLQSVSGDVSSESPFVVKNITSDDVSVTGRLAGMPEGTSITTVLAPGWNPELFVELYGVPSDTLQIGY